MTKDDTEVMRLSVTFWFMFDSKTGQKKSKRVRL